MTGYELPRTPRAGLVRLDSNEGARPSSALFEALARRGTEILRRYPDARELEALIASHLGIGPERVLVTAGADEAIDRACRLALSGGKSFLLPVPTFTMFEHYASLAGAELLEVPWEGPFPLVDVLERITAKTGMVALVSPNNPTGSVLSREILDRVARAASTALVLLDHAYVEYSDVDLTLFALDYPNVVVTRTFSKARGLAGCRVGYALGTPDQIARLRKAGGPYSVAAPSMALAATCLETGDRSLREHVLRIRRERDIVTGILRSLGAEVPDSQANFVLARFPGRGTAVFQALLERGILVRDFTRRPGLEDALRITLPGDEEDLELLVRALEGLR